jgi:hypothetical protein
VEPSKVAIACLSVLLGLLIAPSPSFNLSVKPTQAARLAEITLHRADYGAIQRMTLRVLADRPVLEQGLVNAILCIETANRAWLRREAEIFSARVLTRLGIGQELVAQTSLGIAQMRPVIAARQLYPSTPRKGMESGELLFVINTLACASCSAVLVDKHLLEMAAASNLSTIHSKDQELLASWYNVGFRRVESPTMYGLVARRLAVLLETTQSSSVDSTDPVLSIGE